STTLRVYDYRFQRQQVQRRRAHFAHPFYPTIFVGWDNTPRRGRGAIILTNDDTSIFEQGLAELVQSSQGKPADERVIFVNAWNEWAEGNYLEPDLHHGLAKLESVRRVTVHESRAPSEHHSAASVITEQATA